MKFEGKAILVVDDEYFIRDFLKEILELDGAVVIGAHNGTVALAQMGSKKIDCVLTDIRMPNGDGIELLKKVRAAKEMGHIPVIVMSGFSDYYEKDIIALGASSFLPKPFDVKKLHAQLQQAFGQAVAASGTPKG